MPRNTLSENKKHNYYYLSINDALDARITRMVATLRAMKPDTIMYPVPYVSQHGPYDLSAVVHHSVLFTVDHIQHRPDYTDRARWVRYAEEYESIRSQEIRTISAPQEVMESNLGLISAFLNRLDITLKPISRPGAPNRKAIMTIALLHALSEH